jgi:DNA repair exonuclease SbcCD ATPase subunit
MQTLLDQEKQTTQDMECLEEDLLKDEQKLEKTLERLQADKNRQAQSVLLPLHMLNAPFHGPEENFRVLTVCGMLSSVVPLMSSFCHLTVFMCVPQISELEQEKEHLSQAVSSLRQHAQVDSEARFREVETENRVLHQTITNTGTKLARLEAQGKQATKELETLRERGEELERETTHLERSKEQLQREVREVLHLFLQYLQLFCLCFTCSNCELQSVHST